MNSRDIAEKQDLWNELNDLWVQRQLRRRKGRLSFLAAMSVIVVAGAVMCAVSFPAPRQSLFMQIKGQKLDSPGVERNISTAGGYQADSAVETTETITI